MPTGISLSQLGFPNTYVHNFKLIVNPGSCEHINDWLYYYDNILALNSIYLVTNRPLESSALMIQFSLQTTSANLYPNHYF